MFTIDLLKGRGIPVKSRPEGIAIGTVTFAVPTIIAIVVLGSYLKNTVAISIRKQEIANYETKIGELSDAVKLKESFEKEKNLISSCLSEVSTSIGRHTQWSPVLVMLVKNIPDSVVLAELQAGQHFIKKEVPAEDDPEEMVDIAVPVRTLQINLFASPGSNCDKAIRDFRDRLRFSDLLGPMLEDIKVSQGFDTFQGRDVLSYEIDCIFQPGL